MENLSVKNTALSFLKSEIVLVVSVLLALITALLIHPDRQYISYIDFRTLSILLSLMLVMSGFKKLLVFRQIGEKLVIKMNTTRGASFVLVALCFVCSMFITNDVALITFVPFTVVTLSIAKRKDLLIPVIVLETIAANLGSMTTPIGNPQNLYLYSKAGISLFEFLKLMLPYSVLSAVLILLALCLFVKKEPICALKASSYKRGKRAQFLIGLYTLSFVLSLLVVARVLDYRIGLLLILVLVLIFDRKTVLEPDYSLLLTFIFLFIFIGNMKRMPAVNEALSAMVSGHEVWVGVLFSQAISNVPTAILCSGFTTDLAPLIIGVNFGGLGTLIASMASLISFKQYGAVDGADRGKYFRQFTLWNVIFLVILMAVYLAASLL